jgi:putative hemolysin
MDPKGMGARRLTEPMVILELSVFFLLTVINGLFVMSEMALVSARRSRLAPLAEEGDRRAGIVLDFSEHPARFLSAVQIGITVTGLLAGASSGAKLAVFFAEFLRGVAPFLGSFTEECAFIVVIVAMTFFTLVFGELLPKRIAMARPEAIAMSLIGFVRLVTMAAKPFVSVLSLVSSALLRLIGLDERSSSDVTEDEVKHVLAEGVEAGVLDPGELDMLEGVMRVADRPVRTIMTPRTDLYWIDLNDSEEIIRREVAECPYSLLVVGRGSIDAAAGVLYKKDLLADALAGRPFDVEGRMRQPAVVPEGVDVLKVLRNFRENPIHCAFVVDEYGSLLGLVTLTDIIEGIAGDLADVDAMSSGPTLRDDGSWLFDGDTDIDDLERQLDLPDLDHGSYHTLGGLILATLNRIPSEGDKAIIGDWIFEVVDMDGRRIDKVLIRTRTRRDMPEEDVA